MTVKTRIKIYDLALAWNLTSNLIWAGCSSLNISKMVLQYPIRQTGPRPGSLFDPKLGLARPGPGLVDKKCLHGKRKSFKNFGVVVFFLHVLVLYVISMSEILMSRFFDLCVGRYSYTLHRGCSLQASLVICIYGSVFERRDICMLIGLIAETRRTLNRREPKGNMTGFLIEGLSQEHTCRLVILKDF